MSKYRCIVPVLLMLLFLAGCTTNPATGRRQLLMMSTEKEIALAEQAMPELISEYGGQIQNTQIREYVDRVGQRIAREVEPEYRDLPWQFTVLDSDVINAFALPGGKVFICKGLMAQFESEGQLAGVLGHEIGHVTSQHIDERISHSMGVSVLASVLSTAVSGTDYQPITDVIVGYGGQGYLLKFSRTQEYEADSQGVKYMTRAGYAPKAMGEVLELLMKLGEGSRPPEFFSTHPYPEKRLERIEAMLDGPYAFTRGNSDYSIYGDRYRKQVLPLLGAN